MNQTYLVFGLPLIVSKSSLLLENLHYFENH